MQWHWGNIGTAMAGFSAAIVALGALVRGPGALRAWLDNQRAQAQAAREEAATIRRQRRAHLHGWTGHGLDTYQVALVTDPDELTKAREEVLSGGPTTYAVLKVTESDYDNSNRARSLRMLIDAEQHISRPPTPIPST